MGLKEAIEEAVANPERRDPFEGRSVKSEFTVSQAVQVLKKTPFFDLFKDMKESLGMTWKDFMEGVAYDHVTQLGHEVPKMIELRILKQKEKARQRNLYFFKNELKRLYLQVEWQYRVYGAVEHEQVNESIDTAMKRFECLPDEIKKALAYQKERYLAFKDKRLFEVEFEYLAPKMVTNKK